MLTSADFNRNNRLIGQFLPYLIERPPPPPPKHSLMSPGGQGSNFQPGPYGHHSKLLTDEILEWNLNFSYAENNK